MTFVESGDAVGCREDGVVRRVDVAVVNDEIVFQAADGESLSARRFRVGCTAVGDNETCIIAACRVNVAALAADKALRDCGAFLERVICVVEIGEGN